MLKLINPQKAHTCSKNPYLVKLFDKLKLYVVTFLTCHNHWVGRYQHCSLQCWVGSPWCLVQCSVMCVHVWVWSELKREYTLITDLETRPNSLSTNTDSLITDHVYSTTIRLVEFQSPNTYLYYVTFWRSSTLLLQQLHVWTISSPRL